MRLEHLYLGALVAGALANVNLLAGMAFVPVLVGREHVPEANSKLQLSRSAAQVAGPSLGGLLVQAVTAPLAMRVHALSFLISAGLTWTIRASEAAPSPTNEGSQGVMNEQTRGVDTCSHRTTEPAGACAPGIAAPLRLGSRLSRLAVEHGAVASAA